MHIDKYLQKDQSYLIEGISYENPEEVLGSFIKACGCGNPLNAIQYACKVLIAIKNKEKLLYGDFGQWYFVLYTLDSLGLIEHGTSILSSWVTDEGLEFIEDATELIRMDEINS